MSDESTISIIVIRSKRSQSKINRDSKVHLVSSPDSLFVFGWGGSLVDRANIFVPALEVLVCRFGGVRYESH